MLKNVTLHKRRNGMYTILETERGNFNCIITKEDSADLLEDIDSTFNMLQTGYALILSNNKEIRPNLNNTGVWFKTDHWDCLLDYSDLFMLIVRLKG